MRLHHVRQGQGPPLVLLHGIGDSVRAFRPVMGLLAAHHEVIAIDMPGFGASPPLEPGPPTVQALAAAVMDFMGDRDFHVAGNSMGGGVAFEIAKAGRALSVTGVSPIGFGHGWETFYEHVSLLATYRLAGTMPRRLGNSALGRRLGAWQMLQHGERMPPDEFRGLLDDCAGSRLVDALPYVPTYRFTGGIGCPATIAWGDHDRLLLYGRQAARARRLFPEARHVTLTGCGHIPAWDDPEQTAEAILATTRSQLPREPAAEPAGTRSPRA